MEQETVYDSNEDSHVVMCEKVQSLAGSVYQELERMIAKYDEDVVKNLMPLVVNILESLDFAYTENQEHEVELELLREDNEQLVTQYEREKQLRRASEQKLFELEDHNEEQVKQSVSKIESLESIVRMFELKTRNASDHVARLEEKEDTMRKEYAKLHDRYTELFKTHMDYMERTKILLGTDRLDQLSMLRPKVPLGGLQNNSMTRSAGPLSFQLQGSEPRPAASASGTSATADTSAPSGDSEHQPHGPNSLQAEIQVNDAETAMERHHTADKGQTTDVTMGTHDAAPSATNTPSANAWDREMSMDDVTPDHEDMPSDFKAPALSNTTKRSEHRSANNLYQELSFQDATLEPDDGGDVTGGWVHPGEFASSESDDEDEGPGRRSATATQKHASDNFFGMGREVENLIMENNELLATKNALNIVKDDLIAKVDELTGEQEILREEVKSQQTVRSRLQLRVQELEDELKKMKEDAEKTSKETTEEDDIPMAQRKRFTRVEMARVLMERNQYKERFMELQEAVRWTEMIRASRSDGQGIDKKSKQGIWKFFSNLFSSTDSRPSSRALPSGNVLYDAPSNSVSPAEPSKRRGAQERKRGLDFLDTDISSEKLQQRRATERREQYKQVRAHVKKDDGRMQAYGWSLPAKVPSAPAAAAPQGKTESQKSSHVPVPVPVYCRPLMEKEQGMKIWCAAGVNLTGGRTRDGGSVVGASVFYSGECAVPGSPVGEGDEVEQLSRQLKEQEQLRTENETLDQSLSSLVWICTSTHNASKVTVIDANNPADVLQSFPVCSSHLLCIASVPGAMESDYAVDGELASLTTEEPAPATAAAGGGDEADGAGQEGRMATIRLVSCATGETAPPASGPPSGVSSTDEIRPVLRKEVNTGENAAERPAEDPESAAQAERRLMTSPTDDIVKDGLTDGISESHMGQEEEKMSSVLPTMWLGSQSGCVYVHSAKAQWKRCIHSIRLKDSVLSIVHVKGRVLASLADGTVAMFHRGPDGQWDLTNYHLLDLGQPQHSIRCMTVVQDSVWCGCRNRVHVINPKTMQVQTSFDAHPRRESQLRQMAWLGDGVWVSIRLDSTLRLYHAHTQQHLQDVDIEPYVSKMLGTGKLGFSFVRITALLISSSRLWIGTGNGVVISVPLNADGSASRPPGGAGGGGAGAGAPRLPGGVVRVYSDARGEQLTPASFIPYCHMAHAQLSFHGHRDAVKFFVAVPGSGGLSSASQTASTAGGSAAASSAEQKPRSLLVMSGGEGYIDFRIGEAEEEEDLEESADKPRSLSRGERSHLIVWQVSVPD
ncbi:C-Jun-amino-terminal kinase-interacting protein 4-like isoform X14 [Amphibalanus amphitrite]|uniref:C-Jun-amino-terminal kinase-interacting protein 4-like isoform X14 n=1 Tax=Amphibalanus amphitrite TaxID=1232801 RepID=UPI001C91680A|nr:C-Jun-amino-terminal kinase-interacting protein 4-like isoform X14 [Amphibalanus amphitrite]